MTKVAFPYASITVNRRDRNTASQIFFERGVCIIDFLRLPIIERDNRSKEELSTLEDMLIHLHKPLTGLSIFLWIVYFEDFLRQIFSELTSFEQLEDYFPNLLELKTKLKDFDINSPTRQLDVDPFRLLSSEELREKVDLVFWIKINDHSIFSQLNDLILIRHIMAHKWGIVREVDMCRFQYYEMKVDTLINPTLEFANEIQKSLYEYPLMIHRQIRDSIFSTILSKMTIEEFESKPEMLIRLIEIFNFFDQISTLGEHLENEDENKAFHREHLIERCFTLLRDRYFSKE
jgi:hypothetical protein